MSTDKTMHLADGERFVPVEQLELERFSYTAQMMISRELAKGFAMQPEVSATVEGLCGMIVLRVRQNIFGQQLDQVQITYPQDWWQALKARFAPRWFVRRWPVREKVHDIDIKALYPHVSAPGKRAIVCVTQAVSFE